MQGLQGGEEAMVRLDQLEAMYYELQLQLYEIQFEILKYEELLLTAQLQSLRRQMSERQEEVVYYDTYESPDAMKATDDPSTPLTPPRDDMAKLQQRTRQLEARRGRITAKKAYLKHKKVSEPQASDPNINISQYVYMDNNIPILTLGT
ncbi:junction-mediating and -regulatory protein-like [Sinocyclocheilus grahami]|uniref:junction-mediating and -regulatory protein-like n=1 Tax=Sinocyclocheilus grahami TaxID=75366 RepID=UPI0007AD181A|nr:PREDICTED: junction-mediating and -regulatory protein-like [Sinocyclocheilus grahami]